MAVCCLWTLFSMGASAQPLINELDINPSGTDQPCEYIELRGTPGAPIENIYLVAFEGDAGAAIGNADFVAAFGSPGPVFGSNGLFVITGTLPCGSRTYPAETPRSAQPLFDGTQTGLENGAISFLLISSPTAINSGTDYDTDNNGTLEGLPAGAIILDAVAWTAGDPGDVTYGGVVLTASGGTIGAVTRFPGNTTPLSAAAFYGGALTGANDSTTYSATIRTANFPANGALTPGAINLGTPVSDAPVDINGDGRTDFVVVRAAGGDGSQLTWFTALSGGNPDVTRDWGIAGDFPIAGDYDGDRKDDITVYRFTNGTFYILHSENFTIRVDQLGQNGDNPSIVGDYNGDGRDDPAVYRPGAQSTWFYRASPAAFYTAVDWGTTGDFVAPGDYDGDGLADFVVQRPEGPNGRFYKRLSGGSFSSELFGLSTDAVVPGDYDGDGKTDLAVERNTGGSFVWDFEPSGTAGSTVVRDTWGMSGDVTVQGDYDGDGQTDYAVWRPGAQATFYILTVGTRRITTRDWGRTGDRPVALYNTH